MLPACALVFAWAQATGLAGVPTTPSPPPRGPEAAAKAPAAAGPQDGEAASRGRGAFPYAIHQKVLANGLRVVVIPMPAGGLATYWTIVRTGSRDEYEPGHTGFAHFFEHMMFRGTKRYPAREYERIITELGADTNASTTDDLTAYHLTVVVDDLARVVDLESDRFQHLDYPEADFQTEAGAVYGEYRKNRANPFFVLFEAIHKAAFQKHTYGHTAMGDEPDIKAMPTMFAYSKGFFRRYYRPENTVVLLVGDVDPAAATKLISDAYGGWKRGYVAPKIKPEPEQKQERRVEVSYEGRSLPLVSLAYKVERFDPKDKDTLGVALLAPLVFGPTSDVYKRLVLDEQSVEFLATDPQQNRDPGLFTISARVKDPAKIDHVVRALDEAIARAKTEPFDPEALARQKSRQRYEFLMDLDSPDTVAKALARIVAVTGTPTAVDDYYDTMTSITPDDLTATARALLNVERRTVVVLKGAK